MYGRIENPSKTHTMRATILIPRFNPNCKVTDVRMFDVEPGDAMPTVGAVDWPLWKLEWLPSPPKPREGLCRFAR